jgi:GNAT superfamily N-acetyltransferase
MWVSVRYRPEDLAEAALMAREHYGESWISDPGFLRWQYEANPVGAAIARLARDQDNGRLAGQYLVIPMRFEVDGREVRGVLSLNTLTREAYRGQGVFTGLARATYEDCRSQGFVFCYGLPNPNSVHGLTQTLGFAVLGRVALMLLPLDVRAMIRSRWGALAGALASPGGCFFRAKERSVAGYEVVQIGAADLHELAPFWTRVRGKYPVMGVRDDRFMRWRYFDIPLREYVVYGVRATNGSELLGYAVGRCTEVEGIAAGMVVDMLVVEGLSLPAGRLLVGHLVSDLAARGATLAGSLVLPHTEEYRILKASGFFRCPRALEPQPFPLCYLSLNTTGEKSSDALLDVRNWFFTMGDYDVI